MQTFRASGNVSTSVLDFAKDLLFDLRYAKDNLGADLTIGNVSKIDGSASSGFLKVSSGTSDVCGPLYGRFDHQRGKAAC